MRQQTPVTPQKSFSPHKEKIHPLTDVECHWSRGRTVSVATHHKRKYSTSCIMGGKKFVTPRLGSKWRSTRFTNIDMSPNLPAWCPFQSSKWKLNNLRSWPKLGHNKYHSIRTRIIFPTGVNTLTFMESLINLPSITTAHTHTHTQNGRLQVYGYSYANSRGIMTEISACSNRGRALSQQQHRTCTCARDVEHSRQSLHGNTGWVFLCTLFLRLN